MLLNFTLIEMSVFIQKAYNYNEGNTCISVPLYARTRAKYICMKYISSKNYLLTKGFGISTSVNTDKSLKQTVNVSPCKIPPSSVARLSTCDILQCMMCARRSRKIYCKNQGCFECKYVCLDFFVLFIVFHLLFLSTAVVLIFP